MFESPYRILIADDDEASQDLITRLLEYEFRDLGIQVDVETVASIADAKTSLREAVHTDRVFDVLILDWRFSDRSNGATLLRWLKEDALDVDTEVILLTGHLEEIEHLQDKILELGAFFYADKASVLAGDVSRATSGVGALSPKGFIFLIKNCIERLRVRREQRKVIDLVGEMHKQLTNALVLEEQLRIVVRFPKQINNRIHAASIWMPAQETDHGISLQRVALWETGQSSMEGPNADNTVAPGRVQGIVGHVFRTGKEYIRNNQLEADPLYVETYPHTKSELCLPLTVESKVIGVLDLKSPDENSFDRYQVQAMHALTEVASPSIRNARIVQNMLGIAARIAEDAGHKDPLGRVDAFESVPLDELAPLFKVLLDDALVLTNADYGAVYRADRRSRVLHLAAERGAGGLTIQRIREIAWDVDQPPSICRLVVRDGTTRRFTGPTDALRSQYRSFLKQERQIKSFLCVPIKFGDTVFGVIDLEDRAANKFSYLDQAVIESFANMVASALGNAALVVLLTERRELIESRARLLGRADLFTMVAHDFKSPINSLAYNLAHCRQLLEKKDYDRLREQLQVSKQRLDYASRFIDETLELAKVEVDSVKSYARIDLRAVLEEVRADIIKDFPEYEVVIQSGSFSGDAAATGNPTRVQLVFKELVRNAAEAVNGHGRIQITCWREAKEVCLSFHDDGPGVPVDDRDSIFHLGYSTKGSTGQGLARARRILELQLGSLALDKDNDRGARFIIRLPTVAIPGNSDG
jgi:signal transduction histidine kinase/CheY-like chemotaxis protein